MTNVHNFGGEKGGVGKSFVCKAAVQYLLDKEKPFVPIETDRSAPDLARAYKDSLQVEHAIFSENQEYQDAANKIYNLALEKTVIVNLSASSLRPVSDWIRNNELLEIGKEEGVNFYFWFVCSGEIDSVLLFQKSLKEFGNSLPHILVKNNGTCPKGDWSLLDENQDLQALMKKCQVKTIEFPKFFGDAERDIIRDKSLSFGAAREYPEFGSISRQRVKRFLREAYAAFDSAGVLP